MGGEYLWLVDTNLDNHRALLEKYLSAFLGLNRSQVALWSPRFPQRFIHEHSWWYLQGTERSFLTFYYSHLGFRINNKLVILSVQVFVVASKVCHSYTLLTQLSPSCFSGILRYFEFAADCLQMTSAGQFIAGQVHAIVLARSAAGHWSLRIFTDPILHTELVERGTRRARLFNSTRQTIDVLVSTQIYTHSILSNLTFGARYITQLADLDLCNKSHIDQHSILPTRWTEYLS